MTKKIAYSTLEIKSIDEADGKRTFRGIATTPTADRSGDIVEPSGAEFQLPIPLCWMHDSSDPVGWVTSAKVTAKGIEIEGEIANLAEPASLKDRLDTAWAMLKSKLVRGLSIGFKPLEAARIADTYSYRYTKWLWLELSPVVIPANGEASITQIKSIDLEQRAASGLLLREPVLLLPPAGASATVVKTLKTKPLEGNDMKTIAEQIAALEATRAAKSARLNEVMQKSLDEGRSTDAAEGEEFDTLEVEMKQIDADITRLKRLEALNVAKAAPVAGIRTIADGGNVRAGTHVLALKPKLEKGIEFARYAMCLAAAKGNIPQAYEIAKNRFADSPELHTVLKAAVAAGTTTDATWAAPLVEYNQFAGDFVEFLRPQTIIGRFGAGAIPSLRRIPFNVHIRGQTSGGQGYWVGQGAPKPLTKFDYNDAYLGWAKVANIAVLSEDLMRFSNPSAERLTRDGLAEALIARLDTDFVDPAKALVANVSPASITNGVTPIVASGLDGDAVRTDVGAAMGKYIAANITPSTAVWIMSATTALSLSLMRNALGQKEFPDITMMGGTFEGLPVITSEYVPAYSAGATVILANASDIWLADDGQVVIDASREASLQMDSAPTNNSATPTATTMVSMFQTNSIAVRAERWINWAKRRAAAVVVISAVNWGE
jgi:HK97 family phage major capsid protein